MAIEIDFPLPIFNVLKYLIIFTFLDIVVRKNINFLVCAFRGFCLRKGHRVSLSNLPIDRFNFFSLGHFKLSIYSVFLFAVVLFTYAVELSLEFSTGSFAKSISVPETLKVKNAYLDSCVILSIAGLKPIDFMSRFAAECVVFPENESENESDKKYKIYGSTWINELNVTSPRCPRTDSNLIAEGAQIYGSKNLHENPTKISRDIKSFSNGTNPGAGQKVIILNVGSSDLRSMSVYEDSSETYAIGQVLIRFLNSSITCRGDIYGRYGEKFMKVELYFCQGFSLTTEGEKDILLLSGSALVNTDAENITSKWQVSVAVTLGREIRSFSKDVVGFSAAQTDAAFAIFLGTSFNRDDQSFQRFAAMYRHCGNIRLPNANDEWQEQLVTHARSKIVSRITVEHWAIGLVMCWPVLLFMIRIFVSFRCKNRNIPMNLFGEQDIGNLWEQAMNRKNAFQIYEKHEQNTQKPASCFTRCGTSPPANKVFLILERQENEEFITIIRTDCITGGNPFKVDMT